jgi:pimeloyl-ACP methyl ester carboxylesterase
MDAMQRAALGDVVLAYELRGTGESIVLIHHGAGVDWFAPLCTEPALASRFSLLRYHRAGYGRSSKLAGPLTFQQESNTFRGLMRHLGIQRTHLVGHSASACICLQIALDVPEIVHSVAVLEPALMAVPSPPEVPRALELYRAGDRTAAIETFLRGTCGANARAVLEKVLLDAFEQALTDADTFFGQELPALRQWTFGPDEARRITQPVLAVVGEHSDRRFHLRQKLLLEWLPFVEPYVLSKAGHLLHLDNGRDMAEALADFFARSGRPRLPKAGPISGL